MFFKNNKNHNKESTNIAYYCTFIFWSGFLLLNSVLMLFNKEIEINSLYLLLSGLLVFFTSEAIFRYRKK